MRRHGSTNKLQDNPSRDPPGTHHADRRYHSFSSLFKFSRRSLAEDSPTATTTTTTTTTSSQHSSTVDESRGDRGSPIHHNRERTMSDDTACSSDAFVSDLGYQRNPHLPPSKFEASQEVALKWVSGWPASLKSEWDDASQPCREKHERFDFSLLQLQSASDKPLGECCQMNPDVSGAGKNQPKTPLKKDGRAPHCFSAVSNQNRVSVIEEAATSKMDPLSSAEDPSAWKTSVDAKSGREYYYNEVTRETQWRKPLCLATDAEKEEAAMQERQTRDFFAAMEANIRKSMYSGDTVLPDMDGSTPTKEGSSPDVESADALRCLPADPQLDRPDLIRTISTLEDSVLADLIQNVPSHRLVCEMNREESLRGFDPIVESPRTNPFASDQPDNKMPLQKGREIETPTQSTSKNNQNNVFQRAFRVQSSLRGSMTRITLNRDQRMNLVLEGENEDASSSHHDVGEEQIATRALQRSQGTISLNYTDSASDGGNSDGEEKLVKKQSAQVRFLGEDSFHDYGTSARSMWMDGSYNFETPSPVAVTREDSFTLQSLASDRSLHSTNSISQLHQAFRRQDSAEWPTLFRQSSTLGLNDDEGEAMFTLAAITQEMVGISNTSSSSLNSPAQFDVLSETAIDSNDEEEKEDPRPATLKLNRPLSLRENFPSPRTAKPSMQRRNTCGTLYVGSTMAMPDIEATIKCICGVYRAHILLSSEIRSSTTQHYSFNDLEIHRRHNPTGLDDVSVPLLEKISSFYRDIFNRAKMEPDCIIISLIYVERLIRVSNGSLRPRACNWRSVLFSCMVLSSKVWDDLSMWNSDFSQTCPPGMELTLQRVNHLEVAVLGVLSYRVKVPASEYAKYYFLLRSMLLKSGLGSEDLNTMNPLDVEGAKELQRASSAFQTAKSQLRRAQTTSEDKTPSNRVRLEHLVEL